MSANLVQVQLFFTLILLNIKYMSLTQKPSKIIYLKTDIGDIECYLDDSLNSVQPRLPSTCIDFFLNVCEQDSCEPRFSYFFNILLNS